MGIRNKGNGGQPHIRLNIQRYDVDTARLDIIADGHTHTHTPKYEILCIELRYGGVQKKGNGRDMRGFMILGG